MSLTQDQARNKIRELVEKYRAMTTDARKGITEAGVAHQFLDPLLEALGWPVYDRFAEETKSWERECGNLDRGR